MMLGWRQFRDTRYLVNEIGQVMNMRNGRKLKGNPSGCRHYYCFRINGKSVHMRRDMLVAELFVSNPNKYKNIAHINGKLDDDRYTNLVWVEGEKQFHFRNRKPWGRTGIRGVVPHYTPGYYQASLGSIKWGKFESPQDAEFEFLDTLHAFCDYPMMRDQQRYKELLPLYRK